MELIEGVVRHYDWGSPTAIPDLLGRPGDGEPWAELWLGAAPAAPAAVGARAEPLDRLIATDPVAALGAAVASRYGRLPFLLKVLAAAAPLSLQAHPSVEHARAGFAREEAMGIPRDAPQRMFRDASAKPELICALSPFEALCGFRDPGRTAALLETLDAPALDPLRSRLAARPDPRVGDLLAWLLALEPSPAAELAESATEACAAPAADDEWSGPRAAVARLGTLHRGDRAVVAALLLNHVVLAPGEALFLDAGCLHVYLGGTAVELMADSDNVVRGGLTSKHVDADALLEVVDGTASDAAVQRPEPVGGVATYRTAAAEFCLRRLEVDGSLPVDAGAGDMALHRRLRGRWRDDPRPGGRGLVRRRRAVGDAGGPRNRVLRQCGGRGRAVGRTSRGFRRSLSEAVARAARERSEQERETRDSFRVPHVRN